MKDVLSSYLLLIVRIVIITIFSASFAALLGCSNMVSGSATATSRHVVKSTKSFLPKVPPLKIPGGNTSNWRYLGISDDKSFSLEIDNNSIRQIASNLYNFIVRITIANPQEFIYNASNSNTALLSNSSDNADNQSTSSSSSNASAADPGILGGVPRYKYSLSGFTVDCDKFQYILNEASLYNIAGDRIFAFKANNDIDSKSTNNVRWLGFTNGSMAQLEYDYVCLGKHRNIGY